jgi:hypothetical protein
MPATVERLPNEPIIIVTVTGQLTVEVMRDVYRQIAEIADDVVPPLYRITDTRFREASFAEMMAIIKEASKGMPGTTTDPRIRNMFVGRDKMAMIGRDCYSNVTPQGNVMPMFETIEEALVYIRLEIDKQPHSESKATSDIE